MICRSTNVAAMVLVLSCVALLASLLVLFVRSFFPSLSTTRIGDLTQLEHSSSSSLFLFRPSGMNDIMKAYDVSLVLKIYVKYKLSQPAAAWNDHAQSRSDALRHRVSHQPNDYCSPWGKFHRGSKHHCMIANQQQVVVSPYPWVASRTQRTTTMTRTRTSSQQQAKTPRIIDRCFSLLSLSLSLSFIASSMQVFNCCLSLLLSLSFVASIQVFNKD